MRDQTADSPVADQLTSTFRITSGLTVDHVLQRGRDRRADRVVGFGQPLHQPLQIRRQLRDAVTLQHRTKAFTDLIADRARVNGIDLDRQAAFGRHGKPRNYDKG